VPHTTTGSSPAVCRDSLGVLAAHVPSEARGLLGMMIAYETARKKRRKTRVDRVGLISDFLTVCASDPVGAHEDAVTNLCDSLLRTNHPSRELLGTFLAALELSPKNAPGVRPRIRQGMLTVLKTCVEMLSHEGEPLASI
jgi:hypothetical protein